MEDSLELPHHSQMETTSKKNPAAVALGQRSAQKRFKGKSKKEISEIMAKVRASMPSKVIPTTNA